MKPRKQKTQNLKPGQKMTMREAQELADDTLPDGAYWMQVHEIAGIPYGEGFDELKED